MLNQNSININPDNQKPALTGEELDNIRKYEPCPLSPYNEEKQQNLGTSCWTYWVATRKTF